MAATQASVHQAILENRDAIHRVAREIHAHPELRYQEHFAADLLSREIEAQGAAVERRVGGLETALRARTGPGHAPRVAILAEYDALPEIGHACGHNLIAAGAFGAFAGLLRLGAELPGEVIFLGTPAEEGGAGKIRLLEAGVFDEVDAAVMFHPFDRDLLAHGALASVWVEFRFTGRPSHAAMAPWDGSSALSAVIQTFNLIDSQRVHLRDGTRIHGYITDGGQAVNIIPETAACQFSVRATTASYLAEVKQVVERCARAAALAAGVELAIEESQGYRNMVNNMTLARVFGEALAALGREPLVGDPTLGMGSTDMGDVSQAVPSIHPYLAICDQDSSACHQHDFARHAASERGLEAALVGAQAMAATALRFLSDPDLRGRVRAEFEAARAVR